VNFEYENLKGDKLAAQRTVSILGSYEVEVENWTAICISSQRECVRTDLGKRS